MHSSVNEEPWMRYLESQRDLIKPSSYSTYRRAGERHLHKLPWDDLTQEDINKCLTDKDLAPSTKRVIASLLRRTLSTVEGNYSVKMPPGSPPDAHALSDSDADKLISHLISDGGSVCTGILLAVNAGLRIGEICAMRWSDVSLEKGTICVQRTVQRIKNDTSDANGARTCLYFGEPKSRSSRRTIPLPQFLCDLLTPLASPGDCFVLTGTPEVMEPRALQYRFKRILLEVGVPDINFHALRHTFATRAIDTGVDVKTLSKLLGHSDVQTTLNIYVHPSMSHMRECMEMIANASGEGNAAKIVES